MCTGNQLSRINPATLVELFNAFDDQVILMLCKTAREQSWPDIEEALEIATCENDEQLDVWAATYDFQDEEELEFMLNHINDLCRALCLNVDCKKMFSAVLINTDPEVQSFSQALPDASLTADEDSQEIIKMVCRASNWIPLVRQLNLSVDEDSVDIRFRHPDTQFNA